MIIVIFCCCDCVATTKYNNNHFAKLATARAAIMKFVFSKPDLQPGLGRRYEWI
jgi:hypothetical protein